jgi:hypothetical protein
MPSPDNELNWWIEPCGSTHISPNASRVPSRPLIAVGKVYPESRSGVILRIADRPAQIDMVSRQLLDVLHTRFPGTRWWIKDPVPAPRQQAETPAAS